MTEKPTAKIFLDINIWTTVDRDWFERLLKYNWRPEVFHASTYAVADITVRGHKKKLRMHRLIANTPPRKVTHHINHNSLDNRRENLLNLESREHTELHSQSKILIKYEKNPTIE